jgi:hypothetical protein
LIGLQIPVVGEIPPAIAFISTEQKRINARNERGPRPPRGQSGGRAPQGQRPAKSGQNNRGPQNGEPGKSPQNNNYNPEKNLPNRLAFIVFCGLVVHFTVTWFFHTFLHSFLNTQMQFPDFVLYASQFPIQALVFYGLKQNNFYDYAGQIAAVSLFGALLLGALGIGLLVIQKLGFNISLLAPVSYGMVYMFMFLEHLKRVKLYQLSTWLCVSWFVFRLAIYPLVFKLF